MPIAIAAALVSAVTLAAGCATASPPNNDPATGQIVLPLVEPGPGGELFRLANASFDITDATGTSITVSGGDTMSAVTASVTPGVASVLLRDDWTLERSTDGGVTFQPMSALLGSVNPAVARALANVPVNIEFDFLVRDPTGTLRIGFGVVTHPRQLVGGMIVNTATDGLAGYADPASRNLDFSIYFRLGTLASATLADGTKQHVYTAGPAGTPGPNPPQDSPVATEFYNDHLGVLSGPIVADLTAAFLQYTVAARPDGTIALSGALSGVGALIEFGPSPIDGTVPAIDPDGFPADAFFYHQALPFQLTSDRGSLSGILRMRHIVPAP
jgi:hypothetical protein